MSVVVACPKCQSRYQVPENAIGKRVNCKNCGHVFAANAQKATATSASAKSATNKSAATTASAVPGPGSSPVFTVAPEKWAQFGIDGPLKRPPEIFQPGLAPPPRDILGNHAADPGFLKEEDLAARRAERAGEEESETEDELAQIVNNPYTNQQSKKKNKKGKSRSATKKNKKKKGGKQGSGSAVTDYIHTNYLIAALVFSVLGLGFFGYLYLAGDKSENILFGEIGVLIAFLIVAAGTLMVGVIAKRLSKED